MIGRLAVLTAAGVLVACGAPEAPRAPALPPMLERHDRAPLSDADATALGDFVVRAVRDGEARVGALPPPLRTGAARVLVTVRREGRWLFSAWEDGAGIAEATASGLEAARATLKEEGLRQADTVVLDVARSFEVLELPPSADTLADRWRGVRGLELVAAAGWRRAAPTEFVAGNRGLREVFERFLRDAGIGVERLAGTGIVLRRFEADQVLVLLGDPPRSVRMIRGNRLVSPEEVTLESTTALAADLGDWLFRNLEAGGRMTGVFRPSTGVAADGDDPAAQWLATLALGRVARWRNDPALLARAEENVRYNLSRFYRRKGGARGVIESHGRVTLSGLTAAALALVDRPDPGARLAPYENGILRTIDELPAAGGIRRADGRTENGDEGRDTGPGQAAFLRAILHERSRAPELLQAVLRSFDERHRRPVGDGSARDLAWHVRAAATVWRSTRAPELRDLVFAWSDRLAALQRHESGPVADLDGSFRDFDEVVGDAASDRTALCLSSLLEAHRIAASSGDGIRARRYWRAILAGLRSLHQVAFDDEVDLHYVTERDRARGGLRTSVYDNVIRAEAVGHAVIFLLDFLDSMGVPAPTP